MARHDFEHELAQTRLSVDMVSRQLTSLTSDVATLSADVRHIMSLLHTRLVVTSSSVDPSVRSVTSSGRSSPVVAGILKSSSSSAAAAATVRPVHRVEFKSSPADHLRASSSSASLVRLDEQSSVTPSRQRRQSVDVTSLRPSPVLTLDHTAAYRAPAHAVLTIPSTDL